MDSLREELIQLSGGYIERDGRQMPKGKKDKEAPIKLFITDRNGKMIKQRITAFEKELFGLIKEEEVRDRLYNELGAAIHLGNYKERGISWSQFTFGQMPVAAILPMLRKFQNDLEKAEVVVTTALLQEVIKQIVFFF